MKKHKHGSEVNTGIRMATIETFEEILEHKLHPSQSLELHSVPIDDVTYTLSLREVGDAAHFLVRNIASKLKINYGKRDSWDVLGHVISKEF